MQAGDPIPSAGGAAVAGARGTDIGNVPRNCLRGPWQGNVDFAISRRFAVRTTRYLEVRAEFFNLLNQVNLANPISNLQAVLSSGGRLGSDGRVIDPGAFGRTISTSSNPRLIQLAVKFNF